MIKFNKILFLFISFSILSSQEVWFKGNLKGVEELSFKLNLIGVEDDIWGKKLENFIRLRFLEHDLKIGQESIPQLVLDVHLIDSRIDKVSSYLLSFSVFNYSIPENNFYQALTDGKIPKYLMISKIFSNEILGQSTSNNLYRDVEKNVNKLISLLHDQWYKDNPLKQF